MKNKILFALNIVLLITLLFANKLTLAKAQVIQPNHNFNDPYAGPKVNQPATVVDVAYLSARPDETYQFYILHQGERVTVQYQEGDFFLVTYNSGCGDPIVGWAERNHFLLDVDVTPVPSNP